MRRLAVLAQPPREVLKDVPMLQLIQKHLTKNLIKKYGTEYYLLLATASMKFFLEHADNVITNQVTVILSCNCFERVKE